MCFFDGLESSSGFEERSALPFPEVMMATEPEDGWNEAFYNSWATLLSKELDAQFHATAWSGFGMAENCCGGDTLASDVYLRTLATVNSDDPSDVHGTTAENEVCCPAKVTLRMEAH